MRKMVGSEAAGQFLTAVAQKLLLGLVGVDDMSLGVDDLDAVRGRLEQKLVVVDPLQVAVDLPDPAVQLETFDGIGAVGQDEGDQGQRDVQDAVHVVLQQPHKHAADPRGRGHAVEDQGFLLAFGGHDDRPLFPQGPGKDPIIDRMVHFTLDERPVLFGIDMFQVEEVALLIHEEESDRFKGDEALDLDPRFFEDRGDVLEFVDAVLKIAEGRRQFERIDDEPFDAFEMAETLFKIGVVLGINGFVHRYRSVRIRLPVAVRPAPSSRTRYSA